MMFRKIIIPDSNSFLLNLPADFIGKQVEIIAFPVNESVQTENSKSEDMRAKELEKIFDLYRTDFSKFRFNREEANDYD